MFPQYLKLHRENSVLLPKSRSFEELNGFLYDRLFKLSNQATFIFYLIVVVLGVGGLGVWVEIAQNALAGDWEHIDPSRFAAALYTYFPALAVASCFDLAMVDQNPKVIRSFGIFALLFVSFWAILCAIHPWPKMQIFLSLLGSVFAVFLWWTANGANPMLDDTPPPDTSAGGNPVMPLAGSVAGFSV